MKAPGRQGEGWLRAGLGDPTLFLLRTQRQNVCAWLGPEEGVARIEQGPGSEAHYPQPVFDLDRGSQEVCSGQNPGPRATTFGWDLMA